MDQFKENKQEVETDISVSKKINPETVQTIESLGGLMRVLYELEGAAEQMVDFYFQNGVRFVGDDDLERMRQIRQSVGKVEHQARSIRAYLTRLKATEVTRSTSADPGQREVEQLGFHGYVGEDYIEISVPYDWVTSTTAFIYMVKKYKQLNNLVQATHEWHWMIEGVLKKLEPHVPFDLPIKNAQVDIVVFKPNRTLGDPDHFWYRPVVDAFVQRRFIMNDDAESLKIYATYTRDRENPEVRIRLRKLPDDYSHDIRKNNSGRVF